MTNHDALKRILALVREQADNGMLWFNAETAPEAYVQAALCKLHELIEEVTGE